MEAVARERRKTQLEVRAHLSVPNMGNTPQRMLLNEDAFCLHAVPGAPPRGNVLKTVLC